jgi:hypothetical protein
MLILYFSKILSFSDVGPSDGFFLIQSMIASATHLVVAIFILDFPPYGGQVCTCWFFLSEME